MSETDQKLFTRGFGTAAVACVVMERAGAILYGVGLAALKCLRQLRAITRGVVADAVACGTEDGAGAVTRSV